jgi:septum site-determining protein MinD
MNSFAFHSYKGGTGKSYLSSNIAAIFAEEEKVCLLDMDLAAPTLQRLFDEPDRDVWVNDFLDGDCEIGDVLQKIGGGNLYVGMANPQPEAIRAALGKSKEREMGTLKRLLSLRESLGKDNFKKLILDTSPGYEYSSINSIATADRVGIITTLYRPDMFGSKEMIVGLYEPLEKPAFMIVNRYHSPKKFEEFKSEVGDIFNGFVLGMKCFCDEAEEIGNTVMALENPSHPLSQSIRHLAQNIEKMA